MPPIDPTIQPTSGAPASRPTGLSQYEIRVTGRLGSRWAAWFDGFTLTDEDPGVTLISGPVVDQAALHGLLAKLRDLGIPLVSLTELAPGALTESSDLPDHPSSHNPSGATQ